MRIRKVLQEFEARLEPTPGGGCPTARGKAEWKLCGDGTRRGKVSVSSIDRPDGTVLDLVLGDQRIAQLLVQRRASRYRVESERGESVPEVAVGQVVEVSHLGEAILRGCFYSE